MTLPTPPKTPCPYCGAKFSYYDCRHDPMTGYAYCPQCKLPCVREMQIHPTKRPGRWVKPSPKQGR